jgi:hypothetical protein
VPLGQGRKTRNVEKMKNERKYMPIVRRGKTECMKAYPLN